jgi:hypothetical protein
VNTQSYWANTKDEVEISPQGVVTYRLHLLGDFSQPMELKEYPQDRHVFELPVVALGYRPSEVVLLPDPDTESFIAEKLSVADWHISNMQGVSRVITLANDNSLPGFVFSFEEQRLLHHYVVKIITPLILIVMMSWVVFWVDPKSVPNQLGVAVTTVLTLIAYHIALSSKLPEIPHLTNMDKFLFSSTVLVFMSLIEVVLTSHLASRGKLAQARRIDGLARWLSLFYLLSPWVSRFHFSVCVNRHLRIMLLQPQHSGRMRFPGLLVSTFSAAPAHISDRVISVAHRIPALLLSMHRPVCNPTGRS